MRDVRPTRYLRPLTVNCLSISTCVFIAFLLSRILCPMATSSRQHAVQAKIDDACTEKLDTVFSAIQAGGMTFGAFLREALTMPPPQVSRGNSLRHSQMVSAFLGGRSGDAACDVVELMYSSRYSATLAV